MFVNVHFISYFTDFPKALFFFFNTAQTLNSEVYIKMSSEIAKILCRRIWEFSGSSQTNYISM